MSSSEVPPEQRASSAQAMSLGSEGTSKARRVSGGQVKDSKLQRLQQLQQHVSRQLATLQDLRDLGLDTNQVEALDVQRQQHSWLGGAGKGTAPASICTRLLAAVCITIGHAVVQHCTVWLLSHITRGGGPHAPQNNGSGSWVGWRSMLHMALDILVCLALPAIGFASKRTWVAPAAATGASKKGSSTAPGTSSPQAASGPSGSPPPPADTHMGSGPIDKEPRCPADSLTRPAPPKAPPHPWLTAPLAWREFKHCTCRQAGKCLAWFVMYCMACHVASWGVLAAPQALRSLGGAVVLVAAGAMGRGLPPPPRPGDSGWGQAEEQQELRHLHYLSQQQELVSTVATACATLLPMLAMPWVAAWLEARVLQAFVPVPLDQLVQLVPAEVEMTAEGHRPSSRSRHQPTWAQGLVFRWLAGRCGRPLADLVRQAHQLRQQWRAELKSELRELNRQVRDQVLGHVHQQVGLKLEEVRGMLETALQERVRLVRLRGEERVTQQMERLRSRMEVWMEGECERAVAQQVKRELRVSLSQGRAPQDNLHLLQAALHEQLAVELDQVLTSATGPLMMAHGVALGGGVGGAEGGLGLGGSGARPCVVCLDEDAVMGVLHGTSVHVPFCVTCAQQYQQQMARQMCPMCQHPIEMYVRVFTN